MRDKIGLPVIKRNRRIAPNVFTAEFNCDFCDWYVGQVIEIPGTGKQICKTCLGKMIEYLDQSMRDNFESDFIENLKIERMI